MGLLVHSGSSSTIRSGCRQVCASFSRRRNPTATRLCRLPSCGRGRGGCSASESSIRSSRLCVHWLPVPKSWLRASASTGPSYGRWSGGSPPISRSVPSPGPSSCSHNRVLLCAPTGKAARRMRDLTGHDAMTIHRALGYSPNEGGFQRDEDRPLSKDYDLVIVDESSMLSLELADAFFRAAGDCHVLLVGDTDQLPPIGAGRVLADLVECGIVSRVHLTAIYRQAARSLIIQSARRINGGEIPFLSLEDARAVLGADAELNEDFFFISRQGPESMVQAVVELVCERIPARYGLDARTEVMTLVPMRRGPAGLIALNEELERRLNPGKRPVVLARTGLRVGSRIVQTKNDYTPDREVMNGEVAFIVAWDEEKGEARLSLDDGEREIVVPVGALETYNLAWALTVHRAQGSQFPAVVAPWSSAYAVMLSRALLYTAVTRAQRLCVLVGERKAVAIAVARAEQRRRHSALAERIVEDRGVNPRSADAP